MKKMIMLTSALSMVVVSNATIVADSISKRAADSVKTYDNSVVVVKAVAEELSKHTDSNLVIAIIGIVVLIIITSIPSIIHYFNSKKK